MSKILSKMLNILKYVLFIAAFALIFVGILLTYKRLEKSLVEAINVFIPFLLVFILLLANIFIKKAKISDNLLFNFACCIIYAVIIIIGLRAKFDTNMILFHKYQIGYNPQYLSDNLSSIKIMLYCIGGANLLFILSSFLKGENAIIVNEVEKTESKFESKVEPKPEIKEEPDEINSLSIPLAPKEFDIVTEPVIKLNDVDLKKDIEEL